MTSGLILLGLIGVLVGLAWTRVSRKMGVGVTWKTWASVIAAVMILGLALYAYSLQR